VELHPRASDHARQIGRQHHHGESRASPRSLRTPRWRSALRT
jgi:hypothetical protein